MTRSPISGTGGWLAQAHNATISRRKRSTAARAPRGPRDETQIERRARGIIAVDRVVKASPALSLQLKPFGAYGAYLIKKIYFSRESKSDVCEGWPCPCTPYSNLAWNTARGFRRPTAITSGCSLQDVDIHIQPLRHTRLVQCQRWRDSPLALGPQPRNYDWITAVLVFSTDRAPCRVTLLNYLAA